MSETIRERVGRVVSGQLNTDIHNSEIDPNHPLIELGIGVDSVSTLELVMALEHEFDIDIDETDVTSEVLYSISTLSVYISKRLAG